MKKYGYDGESGILFSVESDFAYEGTTDRPPNGCVESAGLMDSLVGCAFLSGWSPPLIAMEANGSDPYMILRGQIGKAPDCWKEWVRSARTPLCLYGDGVMDPAIIAKICSSYPSGKIFACPLVRGLSAFGATVTQSGMMPRRMDLAQSVGGKEDEGAIKFDPVINGDAMGRMADLVGGGIPVLNRTKESISFSAFYGMAIHREWREGSVAIVRISEMDKYFPSTPVSAKNYAATSVPVRMLVGEEFIAKSGCPNPYIDVMVATDYIPDIAVLTRFVKTVSNRGFVFASNPVGFYFTDPFPVFWSNHYKWVSEVPR